MKRLSSALAIWFVLSALCFAEPNSFNTGNDIAPDIKLTVRLGNGEALSGEQEKRAIVMAAYIRGFYDSLSLTHAVYPDYPIAIPDGVNLSQLAKVLDKYLDKRPELLNQPVKILVYNCFVEAFKNPNFKPGGQPKN